MIVSRCQALGRVATHAGKNLALVSPKTNNINKQIIRLGHFKGVRYRSSPDEANLPKVPTPWVITCSVVWWWVTWHLLTDYHELIGIRLPNPEEWTDEELGIPPDDAD